MNTFFAANQRVERVASHSMRGLALSPTSVIGKGLAGLGVVVDWARGEICHRCGRRCKLSAREAALLACLARKAGTPVSRDEILSQAWQLDPRRIITRTIDMHISHLRRKLEDDADRPLALITVHGVGYMLHSDAISSDFADGALVPAAVEAKFTDATSNSASQPIY